MLPESCKAITTGNFLVAYDVPIVSGTKYCGQVCEKFLLPVTNVEPVTMLVCDNPVL